MILVTTQREKGKRQVKPRDYFVEASSSSEDEDYFGTLAGSDSEDESSSESAEES